MEHVSNTLKEMDDVEECTLVIQTIETKMLTVLQGSISFQEKFKFKNIGLTVYKLLPDNAKSILSSFNASSHGTINKVNTRANVGYKNNRKQSYKKVYKNEQKESLP